MNYFNRKYICTVFVLLCMVTTLEAEQNSLKDQNPFKDLIDNHLEGFFLSGGVGYGIQRAEVSEYDYILRDSSARFQWKLGYVHSSRLGVYFTYQFTESTPKLGLIWYPAQTSRTPRRYLQALVGFSDEDSGTGTGGILKSLEGGFGYEFRPHFVIDAAAGYNRQLVRFYTVITRDQGVGLVNTNELTLVVSVNYRFY